jgi:hypothetical protein
MSRNGKRLLFWLPRVLAILFAIFLSIFALDVFHEPQGFWRTALAFAIHLIPAATVLAMLAAAWRWEWMGTVVFALAAALYAQQVLPRHPDWAAILCTPLLTIAALFLADWFAGRRARAGH